jgi:TRAP-type mannitol/chloroaromatic compound transport system permease large subunit
VLAAALIGPTIAANDGRCRVAAGSLPYVLLMLLVIVSLAVWPELALWLPRTMRGT